MGGHDDQILADSELGVVSPVEDAFATGVSSLVIEWQSPRRVNRLDLRLDMAATDYGAKIEGGDTEIGLSVAYRQALPRGLAVDAAFSRWWLRRDVLSEGAPVFDYDLGRLDLRLGMPLGPIWLLTLGFQRNWYSFPGRIPGITGDEENQNQNVLSVVLGRNLGRRTRVTGSVLYRATTSNEPLAEFGGLGFWARGQVALTRTWALTLYGAYSRRDYPWFPVIDFVDDVPVLTDDLRGDDAWQGGVFLQKALTERFSLFVQGSHIHQTSSDPGFTYDQNRFGVGLEFAVVEGGPPGSRTWLPPQPSEASLLPRPVPGGTRFRYRDPLARTVSVVGGFNAWDPDRAPLTGPDGAGVWECVVPVPPGRWRFGFVVDGEWVEPQEAVLYEDDGFGGRHGILDVGPREGRVTGEEASRPKQEE